MCELALLIKIKFLKWLQVETRVWKLQKNYKFPLMGNFFLFLKTKFLGGVVFVGSDFFAEAK